MRATPFLIGAIALAGTGMALASALSQEPVAAPAQVQPAAPQPNNAVPVPVAAPAPAAAAAQPAAAQPAAAPAFTAEQKAVADTIGAFAKSFSAADAKGLADFFTDDVVVIDPEGTETRGKAAVADMYAGSFQENPGLKLEPEVVEVRFITPDVARVEGQSRLSSAKGDASEFTRFSSLLVHKDGKWRAAEIREFTAPAEDVAPYERLQELEWMVGHWLDDNGNNKVEADVRWADNNSYLVRTYSAHIQGEKPTSGTMFIGWDPQSGQIKSWNFDSEGGHGEGLWTRTNENEWVVKRRACYVMDGQLRPLRFTPSSTRIRSRRTRSTASSAVRSPRISSMS